MRQVSASIFRTISALTSATDRGKIVRVDVGTSSTKPMHGLSFKIDWVDAEGVQGPELAATMATLEIRVDDSIVTRIADLREQTERDFVYVSVYPLAEWMATNWWFLTHEVSSPAKEDDPDFRHRHSLSAAREGYTRTKSSTAAPRRGWVGIPMGLLWERIGSIDRAALVSDTARAPTPWEAGYRLAQELRRSLDVDGTPLPSMDRIAEAIGEAPSLLAAVTSPVDLGTAALVEGVITRDKDRNPASAFRSTNWLPRSAFPPGSSNIRFGIMTSPRSGSCGRPPRGKTGIGRHGNTWVEPCSIGMTRPWHLYGVGVAVDVVVVTPARCLVRRPGPHGVAVVGGAQQTEIGWFGAAAECERKDVIDRNQVMGTATVASDRPASFGAEVSSAPLAWTWLGRRTAVIHDVAAGAAGAVESARA